MKSVPVILISYKRAWHTEQVLTALKEHNIKNLFIFSDGPKNKYDLSDVYETRLLFQRIDWTTPTIIERDKNIGLANSIVSAVNYVFRKFDRVILLEDDCVPQEHFFEFIGTCLDKYEYNEKIFGISGYTVPIPESILKKYPYDLYFFPRIGSWGWATWKRAWQHFEPDLAESYKKAIEDNVDLSQGGDDIPLMLKGMIDGRVKDVWTLHWILTVYLKKGCYIYPTISHIENIGMDGTGIHCGKTDKFLSRIANENPSKFPDNVIIDEGIYQNFRNYYDIPKAIPKIAKKSPKTSNQLKVVHLSTQDFGGAGKAAYRLHKGLQTIGVDSTMLVLNKRSGDSSVKVLPIDYTGSTATSLDVPVYNSPLWMKQLRKWHKLLSNYPKRPAGLEMFTDAESDIRIDLVQEIRDADIINLHWVAGEIDFPGASIALGNKPVVWTLHDMNPFTGGCHYAGDCLNYKTSCGACPQLGSDTENDLSNHVWKQKYDVYKTLTINIVTPSRWLGKCAAESKLFSPFPVTLIPYGFPIDIFMPYPKAEIRKQLNIPESAKVILFGADSVVNARKGFIYLLEALNRQSLKSIQDSVILTFGSFPEGVKFSSRYPVYNLGRIADENQLALAYSAADVFVIPSLEDNLPNTVVEAMACGVPVVGFNIGGVPDMVDHKKTGFLVRPRDIAGLIEGIDWVISSSDRGTNFSEQCRKKVEKEYALEVQAKAYCDLYSGILQDYLPLEEEIRTKAGKLNQQGEDLFKKGDLEGALNAFTRAIEINPNLATAHNNLGVLYYNRGEKDKALNQYQQGAQFAPENITFQKNLADFYYVEQGRVEEAMQIYVKVLNTNPEDIETLHALAHICVTLEKFDDAKYFSSRILQIESGNKDAIKFLETLEKRQLSVAGGQKDQANIEAGLDEYFVSAIVSAYNSERFLRGCLEDLENQTIADKIEIIVVDSGSEQDEESIVKEFQKKCSNIKYIKTEYRENVYAAWNRAIKAATGKYITNANTDDRHRRDAFEVMVRALDENPEVGAVYADSTITTRENETFDNNSAKYYFRRPNYNLRQMLIFSLFGPHPMWRRSVHEIFGYFDPSFEVAGDYEFFIKLARRFGALHIRERLGLYTQRESSIENSKRQKCVKETIQILRHYRDHIPLEEIYPELSSESDAKDARAACLFDQGSCCLFGDVPDIENAIRYFHQAFDLGMDAPELTSNLALALYLDGKRSRGIELLRQQRQILPQAAANLKMLEYFREHNGSVDIRRFAIAEIKHPVIAAVKVGHGLKLRSSRLVYTGSNDFLMSGQEMIHPISGAEKGGEKGKKHKPAVSVIVRTFKRRNFLIECLESIANQTFRDLEVVLVNDGGPDVTQVIESYRILLRIVYKRHLANRGRTAALNTGLRSAVGKYVTYLDDDDIFYPEHIETLVTEMEEGDYVVAYTDSLEARQRLTENGYEIVQRRRVYSQNFDSDLLLKINYIPILNVMHRRDCLDSVGIFDESLQVLEDWEFWIRLSRKYSFIHIPKVTAEYRVRDDNSNATTAEGHFFPRCRQRIWDRHRKQGPSISQKESAKMTSLVILTCNQLTFTKKCIDSIYNHTSEPVELIVVDNGSTDGTIPYLEALSKKTETKVFIKILKNKKNLGFATGNNQGIAASVGDYIILMNNDIVVTPGWLDRLIRCAEKDPAIGIVGPLSNYVSGPQLVKNVSYDPQTLTGLNEFAKRFAAANSGRVQRLIRVVGFCMLVKRAVIEKIGGMDSAYGLGNFEDDDFSLRAALAGFESWMVQDCFVHHFGSRTFIGEQIDYRESLQQNWEIFKQKWKLPTALSYDSGYSLSLLGVTSFDPSVHYIPCQKAVQLEPANAAFQKSLCNVTNLNRQGEDLIGKGDLEGALDALKKALEIDPSNATTHNDLGVLYYNQGDKEKAFRYYQKAAKLDSENITYQKNLADFYYVEMGKVEEAMQIYVKALNANPKDIETLLVLAHICVALEKFQDARVFYSRVLEIEPRHQDTLQFLDKLNFMKSDNSGPKTPEELYRQVQPMLNNSDPHRAFVALERLLDNFPDFALAHNDLGVLYYNMGKKEKAQHHYEHAVELMPENINFQKNLADYYLVELDRKEDALQIYLSLLNHHPNDLEVNLTAAHICIATHDFSKAEELYKQVLVIDPENEDARNNLRLIEKIKGNLRIDRQPRTESLHESTSEEYLPAKETIGVEDAPEKDIPQFSIIMPTAAPLKQIRRCVESIKKYTSESHEILFVNNGTTKGVLKWVRKCIDENHNWRLVKCGKGANPAICYNTGIKAARGEYMVLLSNDVVVSDGWLSSMLQCFSSILKAGMVGAMTNRARGRQKVAAAVNPSPMEINAFAESYRATNRYRRIECDILDGFCLLFRRDLTETIGLFDEQMSALGFEDEDYCLRAALEGYVNQIAGDVYLHRLENKASVRNKKNFNLKWSGADVQSPTGKRHLALRSVEKATRAGEEGKIDLAVELYLQAIGLLPELKECYYKLAEMLVNTKRFQDALDVLNELPKGDPDARQLELTACCKEGLESLEEAQGYADQALEIDRCSKSALNTKGIIAFRRDDKNTAESYFVRAMETDPGFGEAYTNLGALKWAAGLKDEALGLYERGFILSPTVADIALNYHCALADLCEYQRAERVVRDAAAVHPHNKKVRYMLIDILIHQRNDEMAMQEIETAIADFGLDDGILPSALKIRERIGPLTIDKKTACDSTVSLCMIVKDEEDHLARCLQSVRPVVDEMIIVDTGSKDRCKDIARVFGAKVFDFKWAEDFAEARNYSLSKATGKMVFVMDADEVISPLDYKLFRQTARQSSRQRSASIINTRNYTRDNNLVEWVANEGYYDIEEAGTGWTPSAKIRLFPNDPHIRFDFPVHEMVEPALQKIGIPVKLCKFQVHHYGKLNRDKSERKGEAYYEIGCRKLEEMGDSPIALRELAIQAEGLKKHQEAVELWERYIAIVPNEPKAFINMGISYCNLGQFDKVLVTAEKALKFAPDSKEGYYNCALAKLHLGHLDQSIEILEELCEEMPEYLPARFILAAACCCREDKKRGMVLLKELSGTAIGPGLAIRCHELAGRFVSLQRPAYALALLDAAIDSQNTSEDVLDLYANCLKLTEVHKKTGTYE